MPGPYLTLALADYGTEVIKAPQGGDPPSYGTARWRRVVFFRNLDRSEKSVVLDPKSSEGKDALLKPCETAEVFVE